MSLLLFYNILDQEAARLIIIIETFDFLHILSLHAPVQCRETDLAL